MKRDLSVILSIDGCLVQGQFNKTFALEKTNIICILFDFFSSRNTKGLVGARGPHKTICAIRAPIATKKPHEYNG